MKVLIASDLHGSATYARLLAERVAAEDPDRVALLGDLLYHGPRNELPDGYAPKEVVPILREFVGRIVAVRGNCDSEVDETVLGFRILDTSAQIVDGETGTTLFLTHGHAVTPEDPPALPPRTVFCSGHTHVKLLEGRDGLLFCNPGSLSLPKDGSRSYAVYENGAVTLKALDDGAAIRSASLS